jgi:hypothetical protein
MEQFHRYQKETLVSKRILSLIICLFLSSINAQTNICSTNEDEVVIAFLNGIQNTEYEARDSLKNQDF